MPDVDVWNKTTVPVVGSPVLEAFEPVLDTPAGRFHGWVQLNKEHLADLLAVLTERWNPLSSFVEVNFTHPDAGPAGAIQLTASTVDAAPVQIRARKIRVIPFSELEPYIPRWQAGQTVLVRVDDMPDDLRRRYAATPIEWSLNVPILAEGVWVGLIGGVAGPDGFSHRAVESYEGGAKLVMGEFESDMALLEFRETFADPAV